MRYLVHRPRPPLDAFVEHLWLVEGGDVPRHDAILPSGTVELVVNLRDDRIRIDRTAGHPHPRDLAGAAVSGPYTAAFVVAATQHAAMMGAHFRPGGAPAILGVPADTLTDAHVDLADVWGPADARRLRDRLGEASSPAARFRILEEALLDQLSPCHELHGAVVFALACFARERRARTGDVARRSGLSRRRLSSVFRAAVGLTPKQFDRIARFQRVHAAAQRTGRIDWADVALRCGFSDQSHLANEFVRLAGMTPRRYARALADRHCLLRGHVAAG